jgi:hypothetical protein
VTNTSDEPVESEQDLEVLAEEIQQGSDSIEIDEDLLADELPPSIEEGLPAKIARMTVGERLKLAMSGGREARTILIRDATRLVQRFVLNNPRITDEEIIALAKNRSVEQDFLEIICKRKAWISNYLILHALVTNPKTPTGFALRYVHSLKPRDLRIIAKSKNVPSAVNGAAKRIVLSRT